MPDYDIVMLNNREIVLVNGVATQWVDCPRNAAQYDRQQAMDACERYLLASDPFNRPEGEHSMGNMTRLVLRDVAANLFHTDPVSHAMLRGTTRLTMRPADLEIVAADALYCIWQTSLPGDTF